MVFLQYNSTLPEYTYLYHLSILALERFLEPWQDTHVNPMQSPEYNNMQQPFKCCLITQSTTVVYNNLR